MPENFNLQHVCYLFAGIFYLLALTICFIKKDNPRIYITATIAGLGMHFISIIATFIQFQSISSSFFDALSLVSALIVLAMLFSSLTRNNLMIAKVILTIALGTVLLTVFYGQHAPIHVSSHGMLIHIISSISAYAILSIAAVHAILLAMAEYNLRNINKRISDKHTWLNNLPPILSIEQMLFRLTAFGWILLSISIAFGLIYIENIFAQHLIHKTVFSIVSWILFTILLLGRFIYGWRGKVAIQWILWGFTSLLLAYLGTKFVLDLLLQR